MQRKLSEIAEIPKILSSTLATVSQTFDKINLNGVPANPNYTGNELYQHQQKRKLSYDEDAYDYELSDENGDDDEEHDDGGTEKGEDENFDAREAYLRLRQHVAKQRKSKDVTPESDYASENNYSINGAVDNEAGQQEAELEYEDDDADNEGNTAVVSDDDTCEQFNLKFLLAPPGHDNNADKTESEVEGDDDDDDGGGGGDEYEDDDEDDFLTTTFTWNLPNKPKLQINGNNFTDTITHVPQDTENNHNHGTGVGADGGGDIDKDANAIAPQQQQQTSLNNATNNHQSTEESSTKQPKMDTFWPWADREKIIYKQSTCHLVPKKPFGLIEQRIQLLVRRNLLEHLGPNNKTSK